MTRHITLTLPLPPSVNKPPVGDNDQRRKATDAQITEAYARLGNVWKVGAELGMVGQTVHKRMKRMGAPCSGTKFLSDAEKARIEDYYSNTPLDKFWIPDLCAELGRPEIAVCRHARRMGLTVKGRKHHAKSVAAMREASKGQWENREHPRGMLGKKHTAETLEAVSQASKLSWATWKAFGIGPMSPEARAQRSIDMSERMANRPPESVYSRAKGGRRPDIGETYFRSSWEANYARYLNLLIKLGAIVSWEYEPQTFWFDGVKRGTNSYRPDFLIHHKNDPRPEYIEIKGWITPKDRTKWRRMAKYHPTIKLTVVAVKEYRAIQRKWASAIPEWESDKGGGRKLGPRKAAA